MAERDKRYDASKKGKARTKRQESKPYRAGYRAGYATGRRKALEEIKAKRRGKR